MANLDNFHKTTDKLDNFYGSENPVGPIDILMLMLKRISGIFLGTVSKAP